MKSSPAPSPPSTPRWLPFAVGLAALWPLLQNLHAFRTLFYFEDEWDLIDLWDKTGFGPWVGAVFAESFVPLFKLLWGGAIVLGGGSYFVLVALVWLTHAANAFLIVRLAQRLGAGRAGAAFAGLLFGLTWVNYESLAWTVQWSAVLSLTFFLVGADVIAAQTATPAARPGRLALLLAACALASALCFSRGVLTGAVFAGWVLLDRAAAERLGRRVAIAAAAVLPSVVVAWWIAGHASGNHHHIAGNLGAMLTFAAYYYAQSPLRVLFSDGTPGVVVIVLLALAKTALLAGGVALAPRAARRALLVLIASEVGNALLLGLGRFHTGLPAAGSSRYQYGALAALLPLAAIVLARALDLIPARLGLRALVAVVLLALTARWAQAPWRATINDWVPWRGGDLRVVLFATPPDRAPDHFTRLPWMDNERARELAKKYHLH